ncbi:hypothetical protein BJ085DRAFT_20452 [Dimargaris cristalligena]|uniref:Phosphatidic acid phosphatase type 2/haloperoxidase domain-containing protein n=1 Tax=Dimargaris cristalligena TaxID=215637 RepID=A0A4P9ZWZ5_9FUNG|nr:hypothetical protein BJ085DRAFT_20452 [Dimargaris cristalligena]|eukprot:RKP37868.1 hypothetical protein BJ085DRAFT_20452 [Dimargaris cristalligena]
MVPGRPEPNLLQSLDLTNVQFPVGDSSGQWLAYATLVPLTVLISYAAWLAARREAACLIMFVGQLLNELLNSVLKTKWAKERPTTFLGEGYGMPSSHSQFMAFLTIYGMLHLHTYVQFRQVGWKYLVDFGLVVVSLTVAFSRIYLWYHSVAQVGMGLAIGTAFGLTYFAFIKYVIRPSGFIEWLVNHPLGQWVYLRDTTLSVHNVLEQEYLWHMSHQKNAAMNPADAKKSQ